MATTHLSIPELTEGQGTPEVTHNEALAILDVLAIGVKDRDLATPPGSPSNGDAYIVATSPTGDWTGKAGNVAYYSAGWKFIAPKEGLTVWVADEDQHVSYNGSSWGAIAGGGTRFAQTTMPPNTLTLPSGLAMVAVVDFTNSGEDIDTINGGTTGQIIILKASGGSHTVRGNSGNIKRAASGTFTINDTDSWMGVYDGSNWLELSRSDNVA